MHFELCRRTGEEGRPVKAGVAPKGFPVLTASALSIGTWFFLTSCTPKEAANAESHSAAVGAPAPANSQAPAAWRHDANADAGTDTVGRSTDGGPPFVDPVFSAACRGF